MLHFPTSARQFLAFLGLCLLGMSLAGCHPDGRPERSIALSSAELDSLEQELPGWMKDLSVPGLSIAVFGPEVEWTREFGVADDSTGRPVTVNTVFEAASLSKPVFAHLVLQEAGTGLLDLDVPLIEYWNYADLRNDQWVDLITARLVLSHQTGLPNWRQDSLLETQFRPGDRFQYSGEGYQYLQAVLEAVTGENLAQIAGTRLFAPLGMQRSSFGFDAADVDYAMPHDSSSSVAPKRTRPPWAAAFLHTTAREYARFLRALLDEELLSSGTLARIAKPAIQIGDSLGWGLGWGLEFADEQELPALWHWGDNGNFKAFAFLDPNSRNGFVFFANSRTGLTLVEPVLLRLFPDRHPLLGWLESEYGYDLR